PARLIAGCVAKGKWTDEREDNPVQDAACLTHLAYNSANWRGGTCACRVACSGRPGGRMGRARLAGRLSSDSGAAARGVAALLMRGGDVGTGSAGGPASLSGTGRGDSGVRARMRVVTASASVAVPCVAMRSGAASRVFEACSALIRATMSPVVG